MSDFESVHGSDYSIHIGSEVLVDLNNLLKKEYNRRKVVVLVDSNTLEYCLPRFEERALDGIEDVEVLEMNPGEENKQIETCIQLWKALADLNVSRDSVMLNLGGGVIGDMGGFVASTFLRGIDFIQVPTSLLAMVDASAGGKVGVDLDQLKNYIGLFNKPKVVFIDPTFLETLNREELISGLAEMIKHGIIADKAHFQEIKQLIQEEEILGADHLVASIKIKQQIVERDFRESGERKKLNFGHTAGHAIESFMLQGDKPVKHGYAVAAGMLVEGQLSVGMGWTIEDQKELEQLVLSVFGKINFEAEEISSIIELMRKDKKNQNQKINFTLLTAPGESSINFSPSRDQIENSLKYYLSL